LGDKPEIFNNGGILIASCVGVICSCIVLPFYTLGIFVVPVTEAFGWSRSEFQLSLLFSTGIGVFTAPVVGVLIQRFGPRRIALTGLAGLSIALCLPALNTGNLILFYVAYGAMALLGAGTIPVTWTTAVTARFHRQRGLALGIVLSGTGLCAILVTPLIAWITESYGWRFGYAALALLPVGVAGPMVFAFLRTDTVQTESAATPTATGQTLSQALKGYRFWVLLVSIFLVYIVQSGLVPNLIPALTDHGVPMSEAATALSFFGGAVIAGRLIIGWMVDRYWAPGVAAVAIALPVFACLILLQAVTLEYAIFAAILLGFTAGAELDLMAFLAAKYFGVAHYPKIYGVLYAALASASGIAPALYAAIYEQSGSHQLGFQLGAAAFAVSAILVLFLGRYPPDSSSV
jgi:predicted MFS family arabinose efflux permease